MLDAKYLKMMDEINAIILSRLLNSSIPFEVRNEFIQQEQMSRCKPCRQLRPRTSIIKEYDMCPCGSGKIYCECHGSNIRSNRLRIRR